MLRYTVHRRTFGASRYPKGSPERARLNERALTSEYYPSKRYLVVDRDASARQHVGAFTTKRDAEAHAARLEAER